ncbi:uncharacterized protein LOC113772350 [Coffea eugenioides]|uniref:uncharacterized protein LOC113772350 n=1 Tax=Coffea eugenioides TaxID=49369 RepID=UPI000F6075C9|nr:uncharacterized protein LOC113772350 [Coffea eugenioides]
MNVGKRKVLIRDEEMEEANHEVGIWKKTKPMEELYSAKITSCLKTVNYSFNCNGEIKGFVTPGRGIQQGDPLSPYLFLICSEGFSNLLRKAEENRSITGLKISRQGPLLTHLFFADDSLIFCKANKQEADEIMKVLKVYEIASGQLINLDKSAVFFSKNMDCAQRGEVCQALGGMMEAKQGKYFGLPMVVSRTKDQIFGFVRESIKRRLQNWKNKFLSSAGKGIMLKTVAMAMPTYVMSCFKLPRKLCKDISALMANFWWGETNGRNKMHWISWKKMAVHKNAGGLGFKDLEAFNKALLGKQVWRILAKPNLLVSKVLKAKYFPQESILQCIPPKNASWNWQGLTGARSLLDEGLIRRIGNGRSTKIGDHKWLPETLTGKPTTCRSSSCELKMVAELIYQKRWNRNIIFSNFNRNDVEMILSIPLSLSVREDSYYWQPKAGEEYIVESGYKILMKKGRSERRCNSEGTGSSNAERSQQMSQMWNTLWKLNIKHKIKLFIWKCIKGALPVREAVWKDRNKKEFESSVRSTPMRTIERAHKEWMEQVEVNQQKDRKNTEETVLKYEQQSQRNEKEGTIIIGVATTKQQGHNTLGIGVTVKEMATTKIADWVLKERSLGNKVLDEALALKLVLCKAKQQH